jgi:GDP-D-mannose 3', 5'-epimerase
MVTINSLVDILCDIAGKKLEKKHIPGPLGVKGRNSDNRLIAAKLNWRPSRPLREGLEKTYQWIETQLRSNR